MYIANKYEFVSKVSQVYTENKDKHSIWITFKKFTPKPESSKKPKTEKKLTTSGTTTTTTTSTKKESTKKESTTTTIKKDKLTNEGCLIRITNGKDIKYSTLVSEKELITFEGILFNIMKEHMSSALKKDIIITSTVNTTTNTFVSNTSGGNVKQEENKQQKKKSKKIKDL
ncbi:hypothetical protein ABK040_000899 [Willaertia magna]